MLLLSDVLMFATGLFYAVAVTAGVGGEAPFKFMGATPWKAAGAASVSGLVLALGYAVVFHPALAVASGGLFGFAFTTYVAGKSPVGFMDVGATRIALAGALSGSLTLAALVVM